jgi:hypothetical protein
VPAQPTSRDASPYRDDRGRPFALAPNAILGGNIWTRTPLGVHLRRWGFITIIIAFAVWQLLRYPMQLPTGAQWIPLLFPLLFGWGWLFISKRLNREREWVSPIASLLAAHGRCGGCAYRLDEILPEPDGCRVCPECGAAWHKDRHVFTAQLNAPATSTLSTPPPLANQLQRDIATDPFVAKTLGSRQSASHPKLDDDRGVPMDHPWSWPPKWLGRRSADVVLEAKLRLLARDTTAKVRRRLLRFIPILAIIGAAITTPIVTLSADEFSLLPLLIVPLIFLILAAAVFTVLSDTAIERATRREAVRQLRMCCNCGHALPSDPPKTFDNCTPCTHCGRAWKEAEAI